VRSWGWGIAGLAVAVAVVLCAGIWLGGHPAKLPEFLRERLVGDSAGLNLESRTTTTGRSARTS
jgi:hypothetical protein